MNTPIIKFSDSLKEKLPVAFNLLQKSNLAAHEFVEHIILSGSRGPRGGFRNDSDIDLTLIADSGKLKESANEEKTLNEILNVTLENWKSEIELDSAVVFDISGCGLKCLLTGEHSGTICNGSGRDCFGLYKIQKGFNGYVRNYGIEIKKIFPVMRIWSRDI